MNAAPEVTPIPCLKDNYAYLLRCPSTGQTGVVDPSAAQPVLKVLRDRGWGLDYIFNTHHHWDHVGGNEELKQEFPSVRIFGHQSDEGRIPGLTDGVQDGQVIGFGDLNGFVIQPWTYHRSNNLCLGRCSLHRGYSFRCRLWSDLRRITPRHVFFTTSKDWFTST